MGADMSPRDKTLAAVLDELIPPREEPPVAGAGRPEVVTDVSERIDATGIAALIDPGLSALDERAQQELNTDFATAPPPRRAPLLRAIEGEQPFLIPLLLLHTYPSYYRQPDVLEGLGSDARPPFPAGHDIDVGDAELLARIRERIGRS